MFTKKDYANYFEELEDIVKKTLIVYTDIINDLNDQAIKSKLAMMVAEEMDTFSFIKEEKKKF